MNTRLSSRLKKQTLQIQPCTANPNLIHPPPPFTGNHYPNFAVYHCQTSSNVCFVCVYYLYSMCVYSMYMHTNI